MDELIEVLEDVDENDFNIQVPRTRGPTKVRVRVNHFEAWDESDFFDRFRMHKRTANIVLDLVRESLDTKCNRKLVLKPEMKFLCALRFYASGSFLINVGELSGLHKSTVSKIVKQVSESIARLSPNFIKMATNEEEVAKVKRDFFLKAKFPNCVGALDCTHVKIQSPGGEAPELYRNRKGVFSINVQAICDSKMIIRNVVARWPGSTHDSHIFNSSRVKKDFDAKLFGNGVLVGDAGYACSNYLITPLENVHTPEERLFQESQVRTRNPIERCFGVWKRRFPVLALGLRLNIDRVESIIVATAVLNNICSQESEDLPPITPEVEAAIAALEIPQTQPHLNVRTTQRNTFERNSITRNNLINHYFRSLL
jgi:hypothetical protein